MVKKVPIGVDSFRELVSGAYLFCDKTAMIAEFLGKGDKVTLLTRPRRWGKTLNMSMLYHFFASEVNGVPTAGLFDDLAIAQLEDGAYLKQHQGKHPVLMITFKDVKADDFQGAYTKIYKLIAALYGTFEYVLNSEKINSVQLRSFRAIIDQSADPGDLENSLKLLSQCLYQHHGQKVYILIDEYDTPLNKAYGNQSYLDAMISFIRNLFSAALKGNDALERGVLTGILRISKDSMLSGLNNLETYTLLDEAYSSYFGFSDAEVQSLFYAQGLTTSIEQVREWYNGYTIGPLVMYNPWSIVACINKLGRFDVYWVNTGNNDLIKRSLFRAGSGVKRKFEQLMQGASIVVRIDRHLSFDLLDRNETAVWSLLLFAGYLKAEHYSLSPSSDLYDCVVRIPNQEVLRLYNRFFEEWLSSQFVEESLYASFLTHLVAGNVPLFVEELSDFLLQSASVFDTQGPRKSEGFYHGFVLALLASLRTTHEIKSNRESGYGRYDVLLIPKKAPKALLLEFKHVRQEEELEGTAQLALEQIQSQAYRTELLAYPHVSEVVEVGIAFSGKSVLAAYAIYDLVNKQAAPVQLTRNYSGDVYRM